MPRFRLEREKGRSRRSANRETERRNFIISMRTGGRLLNNSTLALSRCPPRRTLSTLIKNAARRTQLAPRVASLRLSPRPAGVSVDKHCEKAKDTGRPRIRYQSLARLPTPCPSPPADTSPFPYEKGDEYSCPRAAVVPSDVSGDQLTSLSTPRYRRIGLLPDFPSFQFAYVRCHRRGTVRLKR